MDRLSAIAIIVFAGACKEDAGPAPTQRVEKVAVSANKQKSADEFCDIHTKDDSGPALTYPALASGTPPAASDHWQWVNLWATWCKPCIEELPRLQKWKGKLAAAGHPIDLVFVSVDENDADVAKYRTEHPGTPDTLRMADPGKQGEWTAQLGLTAGSIPIHVFVSPKGHVRCARAAGVQEQDYGAVEKLLAE